MSTAKDKYRARMAQLRQQRAPKQQQQQQQQQQPPQSAGSITDLFTKVGITDPAVQAAMETRIRAGELKSLGDLKRAILKETQSTAAAQTPE